MVLYQIAKIHHNNKNIKKFPVSKPNPHHLETETETTSTRSRPRQDRDYKKLVMRSFNLDQWFPKWALPPPRGRWRDLGGVKKKGGNWGAVREQGGDRKQ